MWTTLQLILCVTLVSVLLVRAFFVNFYHKKNLPLTDLTGKKIVLTGGTTGVGRATVIELFFQGATIVFLGRSHSLVPAIIQEILARLESSVKSEINPEVIKKLAQDITDLKNGIYEKDGHFRSTRLHYRKCDLLNLDEVSTFAEFVRSAFPQVDMLINNAGSLFNKYSRSAQNFEASIGMNVLSHFLLTELLFEKFVDQTRIINLGSIFTKLFENNASKIDTEKFLEPTKSSYWDMSQYARAKIGLVLVSTGIQRVFEAKKLNMKSTCGSPGVVISNFLTRLHPVLYWSYRAFYPFAWCWMKNCLEGAQNTLYLANLSYEDLQGGVYYSDCGLDSPSAAITEENVTAIMREIRTKLEKVLQKKIQHLKM